MYPSSADTHQAVEDGVGLRPQNGCYIDTHDGLVSAKTLVVPARRSLP